jgi:hypothetical protein
MRQLGWLLLALQKEIFYAKSAKSTGLSSLALILSQADDVTVTYVDVTG